MRIDQSILIQSAVLPSMDSDHTSSIGRPDIEHQSITRFPTKTGRVIQVNLPVEPSLALFH